MGSWTLFFGSWTRLFFSSWRTYLKFLDLAGDVPHERLVEETHAVRSDEFGEGSQLVRVGELLGVEGKRAFGGQTHESSLVH